MVSKGKDNKGKGTGKRFFRVLFVCGEDYFARACKFTLQQVGRILQAQAKSKGKGSGGYLSQSADLPGYPPYRKSIGKCDKIVYNMIWDPSS